MRTRLLAALVATTAATAVLWATPASGVVKTVPDERGDTRPRFDITRATFNNGVHRLSGRAHVANLRYGGEQYFSFTFSPREAPDAFWTVSSKLHADHSLTNRLTLFNDIGQVSRIPCNVTSIWRPGADSVRVSIPRSCVDGVTGSQWMTANLGPSPRRGTQDHVLGRYVRQG